MSEIGTLSFDMESYERFLRELLAEGYAFTDVSAPSDGEIILRHDVDLSIERAAAMARVEAELGVESTYFFLLTSPAYDVLDPAGVRALEAISDRGHDVGLHFDTHYYWDDEPSRSALEERVERELDILSEVAGAPVTAVSFHMPPEWVLGVDYDGFTNAYAPALFDGETYFSDSRQKWRTSRPFPDGPADWMQILVHPGLWTSDGRPMDEIVDELVDDRRGRIETYLDGLDPVTANGGG